MIEFLLSKSKVKSLLNTFSSCPVTSNIFSLGYHYHIFYTFYKIYREFNFEILFYFLNVFICNFFLFTPIQVTLIVYPPPYLSLSFPKIYIHQCYLFSYVFHHQQVTFVLLLDDDAMYNSLVPHLA